MTLKLVPKPLTVVGKLECVITGLDGKSHFTSFKIATNFRNYYNACQCPAWWPPIGVVETPVLFCRLYSV